MKLSDFLKLINVSVPIRIYTKANRTLLSGTSAMPIPKDITNREIAPYGVSLAADGNTLSITLMEEEA